VGDSLRVDLARIEERDQLVAALAERGYEARPLDDEGWAALDVPYGDGGHDGLVSELESLVSELGLPVVPVRGEGVLYLRPPAD
jgi:hypothetical protein